MTLASTKWHNVCLSALGSRSGYNHSSVQAYLSHLWTFCDAARERAIAEDVVAPCLGVAADVGPRLAERVAEAVREATTL